MASTKKYRGIIVPAVTPLTSTWQLDEEAVERMTGNFYKHTISPFILGTTGESASLPLSLKKAYIRRSGLIKQPGTILYAGIASNCMSESIELAHYCFENGVDAVAATLPSYYTLSEGEMKRYFIDIAEAIQGPLIIYNIPATTHMSIPLSVIDELSHHPHIVATKDSERSDERLEQSLQLWKDRSDFGHFLGWAARSAIALEGGSDGLIPSTGNLVPVIYEVMLKAIEEKNIKKANAMQELSDQYGNLYQQGRTLGNSLWALKVLMKDIGLCQSFVMPPLQPGTDEEAKQLVVKFHEIRQQMI
jgi:dihydrodipicolinate synthase/N-acetylneuraminate lyase